ncbi:MAG: hypothetical protein E7627_08710 [Ruminococcaceae bacterium]|nr:hypothetical protein [Oscillospiraceae bacterium]
MNIDNFLQSEGIHCEFSTLAAIASYWNPQITPSIIFFEKNNYLTTFRIDNCNFENITITNSLGEVARTFFSTHNIEIFRKQFTKSNSDFVEYLNKKLSIGHPVPIFLKSNYLNYNKAFRGSISSHCIMIVGISNNYFEILDSFVPTYPPQSYYGVINKNELLDAWEANNRLYYEINMQNISSYSPHFSLLTNLAQYSIDNRIIDNLSNFIRSIPRLFPADIITENIKKICFKLHFDSILPTRRLMLQAAASLKIDYDIIEKIKIIIQSWRKIELLLLKSSFRYMSYNYEIIAQKIIETGELELEVNNKLKSLNKLHTTHKNNI